MSHQSRNLGRGLSGLISSGLQRHPPATAETAPPRTLPLTAIQAGPSQRHLTMDPQPLEELAASIAANGVIQPILVRPVMNDDPGARRFEIVAGERRWRAAKIAGLTDIPVVVRELSDQKAVAIALIEDIQREDLTPAEEARALQRLVADFQLTHQAVADAVGRLCAGWRSETFPCGPPRPWSARRWTGRAGRRRRYLPSWRSSAKS